MTSVTIKSYRPEREKEILNGLQSAMEKVGALVEREAKINVSQSPPQHPQVQTGRLRSSIIHKVSTDGDEIATEIGTNVTYGCVIGSRQQVYEPTLGLSSNIGNYQYTNVLSKDGQSHQIMKRHKFFNNLIDAVSIQTRSGRNPLTVTNDHLVLIWRNGRVIWDAASNLTADDFVFRKRAHNAILDDSNKTSILCNCGEIFWVKNSELRFRDAKYCSARCRHKYGEHNFNEGKHWELNEEQKERYRGENNPQWRDGSCLKPYDYNFNGRLKQSVKERDGFQCQTCLSPFDLVVHHKDWDKMNSTFNNLITLCRKCHGKLNRQDCELPEVNTEIFAPVPILNIKNYIIKREGARERLPYLYDFTIAKENSFVVSGLLVHNSYLEHGTSKMPAYPWLFTAVEANRDKITELLKRSGAKGVSISEG